MSAVDMGMCGAWLDDEDDFVGDQQEVASQVVKTGEVALAALSNGISLSFGVLLVTSGVGLYSVYPGFISGTVTMAGVAVTAVSAAAMAALFCDFSINIGI